MKLTVTKPNHPLIIAAIITLLFAWSCKKDYEPYTANQNQKYHSVDSYQAGSYDGIVLYDSVRNRSVPILVRYPIGATGALPTVVFSHGGGYGGANQRLAYADWGVGLAEAGYIVIQPAFVDAPIYDHVTALGIPLSEADTSDFLIEPAQGGTLISFFYNGPKDVSLVLDNIPLIESTVGINCDENLLIAAGHSGGSFVTLAVAGALIDFSPSVTDVSLVDNRFDIFIAASPHGVGYHGLDQNSWSPITQPTMVITGSNDNGEGVPAASRLEPYTYMNADNNKYLVYINSPYSYHMYFGLESDPEDKTFETFVLDPAVAFVDAYIKTSVTAQTWLDNNKLDPYSYGVGSVTKK